MVELLITGALAELGIVVVVVVESAAVFDTELFVELIVDVSFVVVSSGLAGKLAFGGAPAAAAAADDDCFWER